MLYKFQYSVFPVDPSPAFPAGREAPRPILQLTLMNGAQTFRCYGLVDSGADSCCFPLSFALQLGLDPLHAKAEPMGGLGSTNVPVYYWDLAMDIHGVASVNARIGFTAGLESWGMGLLGQDGFFSNMTVGFDLPRSQFWLDVSDATRPPVDPK